MGNLRRFASDLRVRLIGQKEFVAVPALAYEFGSLIQEVYLAFGFDYFKFFMCA